ncbi:MAG: hypothetical protein RPU34_05730 [Candidatus Sedimenticola sp. (ex Thyasira tokunagai)]
MKRFHKALLLPFLTLFHTPLYADFEAAEAAYRSGDHVTAVEQYRKAVQAKDIRAYGKLAALYLYGIGVDKDYQKAYVWFGLAADTGDKEAERFQRAAAAAMTHEQIEQSELAFKKEKRRLEENSD